MTVKDLNQEQLNELKQNYFYSDYYDEKITTTAGLPVLFSADIPDHIIYKIYNGVEFVKEDFFCSIDDYTPTADYDSPEDIKKCLNCQKADCDNCLKTINGV